MSTLATGVQTWDLPQCTVHLAIDTVASGLTVGGLRFAPALTPDDAEELARKMTQKLALFGVPAGGAKVLVSPRGTGTVSELIGQIAAALRPYLANGLLLGEDLGTTSADVLAIYESAQVDPIEGTAKLARQRGLELEIPDAGLADLLGPEFSSVLAGTGIYSVASELASELSPTSIRVAIQGVGSVGFSAAKLLADDPQFCVVSLSDRHGSVRSATGFSSDWMEKSVDERGTINRHSIPADASETDQAWFDVDAELLIPAAVADALPLTALEGLSQDVRAVICGANGALTQEAEYEAVRRGLLVIPDILSNALTAVAFGLLATGGATYSGVITEYAKRAVRLVHSIVRDRHRPATQVLESIVQSNISSR